MKKSAMQIISTGVMSIMRLYAEPESRSDAISATWIKIATEKLLHT